MDYQESLQQTVSQETILVSNALVTFLESQGMNSVAAVFCMFLIFGLLIGLVIQTIVCILVSKSLKVVPPQLQSISPDMVWFLLIPIFNTVWMFFVFPKVSRSLKRFAKEQENLAIRHTVGDCGESLAWLFCCLVIATLIPHIGILFGIIAGIIFTIYLLKIHMVAKRLRVCTLSTVTDFTPQKQSDSTHEKSQC